jgi:hypothetical protein
MQLGGAAEIALGEPEIAGAVLLLAQVARGESTSWSASFGRSALPLSVQGLVRMWRSNRVQAVRNAKDL